MTGSEAGAPRVRYLLVAVAALGAVFARLAWAGPVDSVLANSGGAVVTVACTLAILRISRRPRAPRGLRGFWRLWGWSGAMLVLSTVAAMAGAYRGDDGMPVYEAVPTLASLGAAMLAFRHVPLSRRTRLDWARLLLDGFAVAVAGTVFFGYVVLSWVPESTPLTTRALAGTVGVGCLLALVVFMRAAVNPEGRVDPGALAILAIGPVVGMIAVVVFLGGTPTGVMLLSVVGYPLVGTGMCAAAYRQDRVLAGRSTRWTPNRPRWSLTDPLQALAVAVTAGLVITVTARDLDMRGRAVIAGAVLIAAIVVARQLLSLRENTLALRGIRRQQAELERLALSDSLTGLHNRTGFAMALAERIEEHRPSSVLLIDVDDFKMINDTLGPAAGDQLLYQLGDRLRELCDAEELPARLGGDEFAVLLPADDPAAAERAATRFQAAVSKPVVYGDQQLMLHASVGIAIAEDGETPDEVLRNADIAMYAAKEAGKASWVRYQPGMRQDLAEHARLAGELHDAIVRGELRLLYQPVYDLVTGRLHGAEALVRWQHPVRGFVSPGDFIPVAERSGLIVPLGAWVLREACEQLAAWHGTFGDAAIEAINVNVAVRQLRGPEFVDEVAALLGETGLTSRNLILEVTESSVVDGWQVRETLQALHAMGVKLALDDFGTGQSSLSLLRAFPVDVLKLDKSFVDGIADGADRGRLAVAAAVAQLAEYLELKAVAEGIEDPEQRDRLREMGYRYGQGYYMAKPLPADEFATLMTAPALTL
ncbi:EAL domain-containing protein [Actinoplanes sp. NPDC051851]|uniref:putative bifunctional diguanylate cyclase/phosphodiesterase n=1 Tax=Actinoplanes sp. NPDC051851 TaxID=3154753 RepID=UPI00343DA424